MADQEEDFSSLPLRDRFVHKNWKVRKEGYEDAAKAFDNAQSDADTVVREFTSDPSLLKGAVADSNVAAQQEGVAALCSFLNICSVQGCTKSRHLTIPPMAEKALVSTRAAIKQKALEAILLYVELDKADPVVQAMLPFLEHKQPKVIAAALSAFTSIYHEFGVKVVEPKPVLKALPKCYGHADKNVRAEAQILTVELYRWLKAAMKPLFWDDLKPVQQQDLEKLFEKYSSEPAPTQQRFLRSQQAKVDSTSAMGIVQTTSEEEEGEADIDLEPEVMTVNVFPKIPQDLQERLASPKWKDRKEAVDDLFAVVNVPAIDEGPFDEILRALAKCQKDTMIAVVITAANCVEAIAKGLRNSFSKYRSIIMSPLMERLKEKKQTVTDALGAALDAVFASSSINECLDDILEFMKNKNPQVKLETTRFLVRCLKNTREAPSIEQSSAISGSASKLLSDSQEIQRTAAAEVLGTLWKIMGDRVMNSTLDGMDELRKVKVQEFNDAAEVKAKHKPKAAAAPKAATAGPGRKSAGPAGKKTAPAATKKTASTPAPVPVVDIVPLQPRPTARPSASKSGSVPPPRGLKPPSTIGSGGRQIPGPMSGPRTASSIPSTNSLSPQRTTQYSQYDLDEPTPAPKVNRGLTGRNLHKPSTQPPNDRPQSPRPTNALSSTERAELEDLRSELSRLHQTNESLRSEHLNLTSQIHELQNQNAQLIEDHTRDVLSIKAKETQLVRARSDAESAEQNAIHLQHEVDRLKREMNRIGRADRSPRRLANPELNEIYEDEEGKMPPTASSGSRTPSGEGKENILDRPGKLLRTGSGDSASANRPFSMFVQRPGSRTPGASATGQQGANGNGISSDSDAKSSASSGRAKSGDASGQGVESWKRAAEVTQNLKARIEMMKAKQGLSR